MACAHRWHESAIPDYMLCDECGSYRSAVAPPPEEVYTAGYWDGVKRSTIKDQVYNITEHREGGATKADYVKALIRTRGRDAALEIGCAPGVILRMLREQMGFQTVVGVEACDWWADICDTAGCHVHAYTGFFPGATRHATLRFDVVLALDVFEHSPEPEAFLAECARLLKPHGQLILMLPLSGERRPAEPRMFLPVEHVYIHSERNLLEMLADAGFCGFKLGRWAPGHESVSAVREGE